MRTFATVVVAALAAIALALCVGAVWAVATMFTRDQAPWMVLPAALVAVLATAAVPPRLRLVRALAAAVLTIVSVAYAYALSAASVVAGSLDVPFLQTLVRMGPEMAFAIADARTGPVAIAIVVVGALGAGVAAWWVAGRAARA